MKFKALLISTLLLAVCIPSLAIAQGRTSRVQQVIESQLPQVAPHFDERDRTIHFRTRRQDNDVRDLDAGVVRARYRIQADRPTAATPKAAARAYLLETRETFGLAENLNDLALIDEKTGKYSSHFTYQQTLAGLPVHNRFVKINLDAADRPSFVLNGYATHLAQVRDFDPRPRISSDGARDAVRTMLEATDVRMSEPVLVVYPEETPRLAWKTTAWPLSPALELEILVDARNGDIITVQHTSTHLHQPAPAPAAPSVSAASAPGGTEAAAIVSGQGYVFDPDPLTTAGLLYGTSLADNNDQDSDALNDQRILVDLLDITQGTDGLYRLTGPHVEIVSESSGGTNIYIPPAEASPDGFQYTRANDFFEAVNVYYHIDKSQRYLQSLDVGHDIQNTSIAVNPHGLGMEDNSRYYTNLNYIAFGEGGVDDAEDSHVIWHEYGHALLQGSAPGLLNTAEGQALHEGWADYWAASYARSLVDGSNNYRTDWRTLFKWDSGDGSIWQGREMTFAGKYPDDIYCDTGGFQCNIYDDGLLWASTLMEVYDDLGRTVTDRLALASHAYLASPVSFRDAAEAIIQADADLYAGAHIDFLIQTFNNKGLLDISAFGPFVFHEELPPTEQLGGFIPIAVRTSGISAPIENVNVYYSIDGGALNSLALAASAEDLFEGQLPLPETAGELTYYIEAQDELTLTTRLPASDFQTFAFTFGPDNEPPTIAHEQHASVTLVDWPAELVATVDDNLGIDTVLVSFRIHDANGNLQIEDSFSLTRAEDVYRGSFPVALEALEPGSSVSYQITVRDASVAGNETLLPETGYYVFNIIIEGGVFREYDFESEPTSLAASGAWQRGAPAYGIEVAHSADNVWATNLEATYPATAQQASLELPPMNMIGIPDAYLVFWQWFDTEHDGSANPDSDTNALLWDGGNIKVSTDGGGTWQVLEPDGGYNGTIAAGRENPLENEPAFGGYSYGWRQTVARLPVGSEVRIRFDFGTDVGNTETARSFAGWYLDDISVLTEKPVDTDLPRATLLPSGIAIRDAGQLPPEPYIELADSTGIASVFVDFTLPGDESGSYRLPMSSTCSHVFTAAFPFDSAPFISMMPFTVGDILTYRFRVSDFAGNTAVFPSPEDPPITVEYRLRDRVDLLMDAAATGLWVPTASAWEVAAASEHEVLSSLIFGPLDLPENVDNLQMQLFFDLNLIRNHGGNIKISTDHATTWRVIAPQEGYNGHLSDVDTVPELMRGQGAFTGQEDLQLAVFDLLDYKGQQIWLRADFGAQSDLTGSEFWRINEATLAYSTLETVNGGFDVPRTLALHENYPDPFASTTNLSYTLPARSPVKLEVYDILGRRVKILVDAEQAEGTYALTLDGSGLSNGLYLVRLETSQGSKIERIVVAR